MGSVVTTQLEEDDLLELVAANFDLELESNRKALILKSIERFLVEQARAGKRVVLIIDEAQNLSPRSVEELRMLSNFQSDGMPLLQIFLVGQSELRATLLSPGFEQLRQRVIATYHLNPLDEDETQAYIEHRLGRVDWSGDPEFTEDGYQAIHDATDGVPRRVNNLCDRLLLYAFLEDLHEIDAEAVKTVADEIGSEFSSGLQDDVVAEVDDAASSMPGPREMPLDRDEPRVFDRPGEQLESMARVMFDKANVQQRLAALERAVDSLGLAVKPELAELREEMAYIRGLLEDVLIEVRSEAPDPSRKRRA